MNPFKIEIKLLVLDVSISKSSTTKRDPLEILLERTLLRAKFFTFLFAMLQPAKKLSNVHITINNGIASAIRIFAILDYKDTYNEKNKLTINSFNKSILFKNVSFRYNENQKNNKHHILYVFYTFYIYPKKI